MKYYFKNIWHPELFHTVSAREYFGDPGVLIAMGALQQCRLLPVSGDLAAVLVAMGKREGIVRRDKKQTFVLDLFVEGWNT